MPRLPRFRRASNARPLALTARDREIIRVVCRHRFARSSYIRQAVGGSAQQISRRLQLLFHHGYLERPRCQIDYYHRGGSREIIYGLGNRGATLLGVEDGIDVRRDWGPKNRSVGRIYLEHAVFVSDLMLSLEFACRRKGARFIPETELSAKPFSWRVEIEPGVNLGIIPDKVFGLEWKARGALRRSFFFLEADRGTMPVIRRNRVQTSFYRKLVAYQATWEKKVHEKQFGFHRFRVLTVSQNQERLRSIIEACRKLPRGQGLFLFADKSVLDAPDGLLSGWQSADGGSASLLD